MTSTNEAIIAAAGSGKTRCLIDRALADPERRSLIVTYTNENLREINERLWEKAGGPSPTVVTMTWFEFLLRDGIKPYQTYKTEIGRVRSVNFVSDIPPFSKRSDFERYYLDSAGNVYRDAASDLAYELDVASEGKVIRRLEAIYDQILVDEVQDMAGYDLKLLELLMKSKLVLVMVGDPRQAVYSTNNSGKNSQFRGSSIIDWFAEREKTSECAVQTLSKSFRCVQAICDVADSLYPDMAATESACAASDSHEGVFLVHESDRETYIEKFKPQELRWNRQNKMAGPLARNFGQVKGQSFTRVLIYPTGTITNYLEKKEDLADATRSKFYVALTRARLSVAVVTKKRSTSSGLPIWSPPT